MLTGCLMMHPGKDSRKPKKMSVCRLAGVTVDGRVESGGTFHVLRVYSAELRRSCSLVYIVSRGDGKGLDSFVFLLY